MRVLALALAAALASPCAAGDGTEIAGYLGLRDGASIEGADADPALSWGASVGWWVRQDAWFEVLFDRQTLDFGSFDLDVDHLQFGGGYEPPRAGLSPYVTVAAGVSHYGASPGSVSDSVGLSGSIAGGFKVPLGARGLFRLEARGFGTLTSSDAAVVCGPGCAFAFDGEGFWQFAARAAIGYRFQ